MKLTHRRAAFVCFCLLAGCYQPTSQVPEGVYQAWEEAGYPREALNSRLAGVDVTLIESDYDDSKFFDAGFDACVCRTQPEWSSIVSGRLELPLAFSFVLQGCKRDPYFYDVEATSLKYDRALTGATNKE